MRIGILGGTGPAGTALGARLASVGYEVVIGLAVAATGRWRLATSILAQWPDRELAIDAGDNDGAAEADLVVIATPWDSAATTAHEHAPSLDGQGRRQHGQRARAGRARSSSRSCRPGARWPRTCRRPCRDCRVVAAFHHLPATELGHLGRAIDSDVLICCDDPSAVKVVSARSSRKIPGCRPLDAGELSNATAIEAFTAVLLQLNVRYQTRVAPEAHGHQGPEAAAGCRCASTTPPAGRSCRSSPGPVVTHVHVRHHAVRRHPPRPRHHVSSSYDVLQRRLIDLGHDGQVRAQRHRRRRPAVRQGPRARRALPRPGRRRGGPVRRATWTRSTSLPVLQHAAGLVGHPRHPRLHRHGARPGLRLPGRRLGVLRRVDVRRRSARSATTTEARCSAYAGRARRQRRRPATSATRSTSCCGSRRRADEPSWETMWGPGRPGWHIECSALALRELGTHHRPARRRHRPDLPAPRVRAGPERGRHRRAVRAPLDARRHGLQGRREDVEEPRQPGVRRPAPRGRGTRGRSAWPSSSTTTAHEWEWDDELMPRAAARLDRWLGGAGPAADGDGARRGPRARSTTTSTRRGALAAIDDAAAPGEGVGEAAALLGVDLDCQPSDSRTSARGHRPRGGNQCRVGSAVVTSASSDEHRAQDALQRRVRRLGRPSPSACGTSTSRASTACPPTGPAILCPNHISFLDSAFLMLHVPRQHQLRRQGRVHGLVEDQVPLPGDRHDPDRPLRRRQEPGRARRGRAACCGAASCSGSSPRAPAAATACSTRAAPARPGWR